MNGQTTSEENQGAGRTSGEGTRERVAVESDAARGPSFCSRGSAPKITQSNNLHIIIQIESKVTGCFDICTTQCHIGLVL